MRKISVVCVLAYVLHLTSAWTDYLTFDSCSIYSIHNVNNDKSYVVNWNGAHIDTYSCKIGFHGFDYDNPLDEYKVCITATTWDLKNSHIYMKYWTGLNDELKKMYSQNSYDSPTTEWCAEPGDYVDVELFTSTNGFDQGQITISVTAERTYNYGATVGAIVGGVIGGLALLFIVVTAVIIVACRRKRSPGITYGTAASTGTIVTQAGYQQTGGYGNPPPYYAVQQPQYTYPVVAPVNQLQGTNPTPVENKTAS